MSGGIEDLGSINMNLGGCLGLAWLIVFIVLVKGIQSLGKVNDFHTGKLFNVIFPQIPLLNRDSFSYTLHK